MKRGIGEDNVDVPSKKSMSHTRATTGFGRAFRYMQQSQEVVSADHGNPNSSRWV